MEKKKKPTAVHVSESEQETAYCEGCGTAVRMLGGEWLDGFGSSVCEELEPVDSPEEFTP